MFSLTWIRKRAANELTQALRDNTEKLTGVAAGINQHNQSQEIIAAFQRSAEQVDNFGKNLERAASCPLPVQTFPLTDDFLWEKEKEAAASIAKEAFSEIQVKSIECLSGAHKEVDKALEAFFAHLDEYGKDVNRSKNKLLQDSLDKLMTCSPKRVVAGFQKYSLEIGWAYVSTYNRLIDSLARRFPRCRAGIYAARLNYSDVIQISEEVLATLRVTFTLLEDIQRRYELLENLQSELKADMASAEISKIFEAVKGSLSDIFELGNDDENFFSKLFKRAGTAVGVGPLIAIMSALAVPSAQFQGQLAREQRLKIFIATSALVRMGWADWLRMNREVVVPNLEILFVLKKDFVANRVISLCDLVTVNGYDLADLAKSLKKSFAVKLSSLSV